ncbi:hypothetical protein AWV79_08975 [Cupriavidus sp. UYMMa02A]|nr:hypothetical protein AWV79_08975 [Cupriavidus sp. UYMMa02A]
MKRMQSLFLMVMAMLAAEGTAHAQRVVGGMGEEVRIGVFPSQAMPAATVALLPTPVPPRQVRNEPTPLSAISRAGPARAHRPSCCRADICPSRAAPRPYGADTAR